MRQSWYVQTRLLRNDRWLWRRQIGWLKCAPLPFIVSRIKSSSVLAWMRQTPIIFKAELYWNIISVKELRSNWCSANFLLIENIILCVRECYFVVRGNKNWTRIFKNQRLQQERSCCYICVCGFHQLIKIKEILGNVWHWPYLIRMCGTDLKVNWN